MPENLGGEFSKEIAILKMADGESYARLYAYDLKRKACLIECLGKPLNQLGYSVKKQLRIICGILQKVWNVPVENVELATGNTAWFKEFIEDACKRLDHPCSHKVIEQALSYLQSRTESENTDEFVMLHGDGHGGNTLETVSGNGVMYRPFPLRLYYCKSGRRKLRGKCCVLRNAGQRMRQRQC